MAMRIIFLIFLILISVDLSAQVGPFLYANTDYVDFGRVPQDSWFFHKVVLKSEDIDTLRITDIDTYCSCINISFDKEIIPPYDSAIALISFYSSYFVGNRDWRPHIYINGNALILKIRLTAFILADAQKYKPLHVFPHTVVASQFGDNVVTEFPLNIINVSGDYLPLDLKYDDTEFFRTEFPTFVAPHDTAVGKIILNEKGINSDFETSITFEYPDEDGKQVAYSVPIKRNIYRRGE
jgi:hypothetical protein